MGFARDSALSVSPLLFVSCPQVVLFCLLFWCVWNVNSPLIFLLDSISLLDWDGWALPESVYAPTSRKWLLWLSRHSFWVWFHWIAIAVLFVLIIIGWQFMFFYQIVTSLTLCFLILIEEMSYESHQDSPLLLSIIPTACCKRIWFIFYEVSFQGIHSKIVWALIVCIHCIGCHVICAISLFIVTLHASLLSTLLPRMSS